MRCFALIVLCCAALSALEIGQPAPPLTGVTWVKGTAPTATGVVTVVEFWATWCGPCLKSIPHLTALQREHGEKLQVIGLSDEDLGTVKPFVEKQGEKMEYRVGLVDEPTRNAYMEGVNGIPHAFLFDATGVLVWAGHPMEMDGPLTQVLAGTFDAAAAKKISDLNDRLQEALSGREPDIDGALKIIDELLTLDPVHGRAIDLRIAIGNHIGKPELVRETLERIPVDRLEASAANGLAWDRVTAEDLGSRHLDLAQRFIAHALKLKPDEAAFIDTQARLYYQLGLVERALAEQERAVALEPKSESLVATRDYYRQLLTLRAAIDKPAAAPTPVDAPLP